MFLTYSLDTEIGCVMSNKLRHAELMESEHVT